MIHFRFRFMIRDNHNPPWRILFETRPNGIIPFMMKSPVQVMMKSPVQERIIWEKQRRQEASHLKSPLQC